MVMGIPTVDFQRSQKSTEVLLMKPSGYWYQILLIHQEDTRRKPANTQAWRSRIFKMLWVVDNYIEEEVV